MKKVLLFLSFSIFCICGVFAQNLKIKIDEKSAREKYQNELEIRANGKIITDESVKREKNVITIIPVDDETEYSISGKLIGKIVVAKEGMIVLNNAYIENNQQDCAISFEAKCELKIQEKTVNYIISNGESKEKVAALQGKDLEIGGKGDLYVKGAVCHGVKAKDLEIKGSGNFYFEGTKDGSAINCKSFKVKNEKTFSAYFLNSKNGIKADESIEISSGTFYFNNNNKDLKVDAIKEEDKKSDKKYGIFITGGKINNDEKK